MSRIQAFDFSVDLLRVLTWQYDNAPNLRALLQAKQDWYDANYTQFWNDWVTDVFDIRTANDFGLSVWAVILDLPLFGDTEVSPPNYPAFGFDPFGSNFSPDGSAGSNGGNFATDARGAFGISTERKRILLRLRYFQLITRGSIPEINRGLAAIFGANQIYALDGFDMTMTYVLIGPEVRGMQDLFQLFDILPRPNGVGINFTNSDFESFGFDPVGLNFNNGSFAGGS